MINVRQKFKRVLTIINDLYIDFSIQKRFIGDRIIKSVDPDAGISQWQSTTYSAIDSMFFKNDHIKIKDDDILVDVGCGDGKVFNLLLYKGLKNKMLGYEINTNFGLKTKKALKKYPNINITCDDIFAKFPYKANVFYLFNPFDQTLMKKFIDQILKMRSLKPTIIYNNPKQVELFNDAGFNVKIIKLHQYKHMDGQYAVITFKD